LRLFLSTVPRPFRVGGHPPASFSSSSACSSNRLPPVLAELPPCSFHPVRQKAPSWGFSPFSRLQSKQLERGLPLPRPGSSPGDPGWNLPFQTLRPRRFARPRRLFPLRPCGPVSSRCRVQVFVLQGFDPHLKPFRLSPAVALVSFLHRTCGVTRATPMAVDFRALLPK